MAPRKRKLDLETERKDDSASDLKKKAKTTGTSATKKSPAPRKKASTRSWATTKNTPTTRNTAVPKKRATPAKTAATTPTNQIATPTAGKPAPPGFKFLASFPPPSQVPPLKPGESIMKYATVEGHIPGTPYPEGSEPKQTSPKSFGPRPFRASDYADDKTPHLLVCASGSVAAIKIPPILASLNEHNIKIRVVLTPSAARFLQGQSDEQPHYDTYTLLPNVQAVYIDEDEWTFREDDSKREGWVRGDPILHIELRRWADMMLIAPLSANMLAKITNGMAEGLLASVVRAWDTQGLDPPRDVDVEESPDGCVLGKKLKKRILVAPSMNTAMWNQPITSKQMQVLESEWGVDGPNDGWFEILKPMVKKIACGDVGDGAMMSWEDIVKTVRTRLGYKYGEKSKETTADEVNKEIT